MNKPLLVLIFVSHFLFSQNKFEYINYDWEKNPKNYNPTESEKQYQQIEIFSKQIVEFIPGKDKSAGQYELKHNQVFINTDKAIEKNNKIYIPFYKNDEILVNKVRIILPDGKVKDITNKDIKEAEDEDSGTKYKYFALDGLVKGATVEHLIIEKSTPDLTGIIMRFQTDDFSKSKYFELIYPSFLQFQTKVYNSTENFALNKEKYKEKISTSINFENIKDVDDEKYSNPGASVIRIAYKLSGNSSTGKYNLFSYKEFADDIFSFCYKPLEGSDKKELDKFSSKITVGTDKEKNIRLIEDYVKKELKYNKNFGNEDELSIIFKNKFCGDRGLIKIFAHLFNKNNINFEIVYTTNRYKYRFDKDFENYAYLSDFLFYFPDYDKYLDPVYLTIRYPVYDYTNANNYGVFVKKMEFNNQLLSDYEIKFIPPNPQTIDKMNINVDFTQNLTEPTVHFTKEFNGHSGYAMQPITDFLQGEELEKTKKDMVNSYGKVADNAKIEFKNAGIENIGVKPLIFDVSYKDTDHIEKVGNKILLKVGELIGPQAEMYQEKDRVLDVEINYPHRYERTITVKIPEGYSLKNMDKININHTTAINGKDVAIFTSSYTFADNLLTIKNIESYDIIEYPKSVYNDYAKVINAAADFNKIVLVLEKN